ncbi:hypothetical protein DIC66_00750 [Rhodoferax lacus]|uniref:Bacterial Ig-like domain-containing protein n=1 Tax=Rhodoferax lacus TaxID=2184758 RepID=A0A3E1RGH4_9BURK|nr:hypothetical protein [Rhodoferax lacus]RFO98454.1 hypothetical protein DIC66_00750 [Rhodoferax lacus]
MGYLGAQYSVDGGAFSANYVAPTSQGAHTVQVKQTDAIGNVSAPTSYSFTLDTVAPTQTASIASYTGNAGTGSDGTFGSGTTTDDATPVLNGRLSGAIGNNDVVRIFDAGILIGMATVEGTSWLFSTPTLIDGSAHSYTAAVMDAAGNEGTASSALGLAVSAPFERLVNASITGNAAGWSFNQGVSSVVYLSDNIDFNGSNAAAGGSAYQVLKNLLVGKSYTVQYELGEIGAVGQHTMLAEVRDGSVWNAGTQMASDTYVQTSATTTLHSFTFTPTSSTATLVFTNTATANTVNTDLALNQASVMLTSEAAKRAATPLVLDLNGDGVQTVDLAHGVLFDVANTGVARQSAWVSSGDGLLVRDTNQDGRIANGAELFGQGTLLANGTHAANGFAALAQFDANHDGKIDAQDAMFRELKVWRDANGDGVSQAGELHGLADMGIVSFNLKATTGYVAENGNLHGLVSSYTTADGAEHELADVWLQQATVAASHVL